MSRKPPHPQRKARGLGLVEIMIALVIGLMILGALSYLLIGGKRMNATQDDLVIMQENARFALSVIGKAIRQSGYRLDVSQPLAAAAMEASNGQGSGPTAKPDSITLRADPAWVPDKANILQGEEANCAGAVIRSDNLPDPRSGMHPVNASLIVASFSLDQGALRCATFHPNGKPTSTLLASNLENMQLTYAIADRQGRVSTYETADKVPDFARVSAVRVELLMKGNRKQAASGEAQQLYFNGGTRVFKDGFLRQVHAATFAVRNRPE